TKSYDNPPIINTMDAVLDPFDELAELDAHIVFAATAQYATAPPETLSSVGGDEAAQAVDAVTWDPGQPQRAARADPDAAPPETLSSVGSDETAQAVDRHMVQVPGEPLPTAHPDAAPPKTQSLVGGDEMAKAIDLTAAKGNTGGEIILSRYHVQATTFNHLRDLAISQRRPDPFRGFTPMVWHRRSGNLVVIAAYLEPHRQIEGAVHDKLLSLGASVTMLTDPWTILADWNMTPEQLAATEWPAKWNATIVRAPGSATCDKGQGLTLDFDLVKTGIEHTFSIRQCPTVPWATHEPIPYAIPSDLWEEQWQQAVPTRCKQPHAHFVYTHWVHDADDLNLKYAKWVTALENTMISHHQIDPKEAAAFTGRAQGYQLSWKKTAAALGRVQVHDPQSEWWAITLTLIKRYAAPHDKPKHAALMQQQASIIQQRADHFNTHFHDLQFEKDEDTIFRWFALVWAPHLDNEDTDDLVTITATWASRALSAALAKSKRAYGAWLAKQWKHRPGVLHAHVRPAPVRPIEAYTTNQTIADPAVIMDSKKQQWQQVWQATETPDDILQALSK
ncbi:unnamed protein product, partial [Prorocentrum cordatum]